MGGVPMGHTPFNAALYKLGYMNKGGTGAGRAGAAAGSALEDAILSVRLAGKLPIISILLCVTTAICWL
jgi:hypothetical protein